MSTASTIEQEMLALINQERTSRGLDPLQLEIRLNDASEDHSAWMLDTDRFSHTGEGSSSPTERMEDAGFDFSGNWRSGENIAWQSERGAPGISDDVEQLHQNLMNSPGHRANILNPDFDYIGIGIETGDMQGFDAVMVTQNFASTAGEVILDDGATTPAPQPPVPEEVVEPEETEEPETDVTETEEPETEEPGTDVTETEEPETEEPESTEEPEEPGTDVTEGGEPEMPDVACVDAQALLTTIENFVTELLALVDDFEWGEPVRAEAGFNPGNDFELAMTANDQNTAGTGESEVSVEAGDPICDTTNADAFVIFNCFESTSMLEAA